MEGLSRLLFAEKIDDSVTIDLSMPFVLFVVEEILSVVDRVVLVVTNDLKT